MLPYAVIGAGPMGLCTARRLAQYDLPWVGFEIHSDVGGLWDIDSPTSTMYQSAHLISSKHKTEFADFPMGDDVPTYPGHVHLKKYFQDYARHFNLYAHYEFNTEVIKVAPQDDHWVITTRMAGKESTRAVAGVLIANGTLHHANELALPGQFTGQVLHAKEYRYAEQFKDQRVLIVGCGNSGCDIAVDAVHQAASVDMSVRRGYYFLPKFIMGKPTDTLGGMVRLPNRLKQWVDGLLIRLIIGKPSQYGLPDPDYRLYESHPVINSIFLHHIGHGDIKPRPSITKADGNTIHFSDGKSAEYDMVLAATGYKLHYPFIDSSLLNWRHYAPELYLNVFNPKQPNLFVMGMVEAAGLGWQGRDDQAHLVALFLRQRLDGRQSAQRFAKHVEQQVQQRADGGMAYLDLERMSYYVHKDTYLQTLHTHINALRKDTIWREAASAQPEVRHAE